MDISSRFSLIDFLAYLFPGMLGTLGIYLLLFLTPLKDTLANLPKDFTVGILFLALSYVLGVIFSGFAELLMREWKIRRHGGLKERINLQGFEGEVSQAFKNIFEITKEDEANWSIAHYYLCRSLVLEYMPKAAQVIERQSSLRQLRMNMIPSILIWLAVGASWGYKILGDLTTWGIVLIVFSVSLSSIILIIIVNRMNSNEEREVRETLTAFIAGNKAGAFKAIKEKSK